jgi:hypothetical protein
MLREGFNHTDVLILHFSAVSAFPSSRFVGHYVAAVLFWGSKPGPNFHRFKAKQDDLRDPDLYSD